MEIRNMSEKKFKSLSKLPIEKDVLNTEAEMFIIEEKSKWHDGKLVFKKLYLDSGEVFSNKLYTLNELVEKKDELDIEELVFPNKLISVKGEIAGFTMPYIDNINLKTILSCKEIEPKIKIDLLKEVGKLLDDIKHRRDYKNIKIFYLNDMHESNFILNKETGKINIIDLDSSKIGNSLAQPSKYLNMGKKKIESINKYHTCENNIGGLFIPDENTDLFCYVTMILNYIYNGKILELELPEFYTYLEYLKMLGLSNELIDKFELIYTNKSNENPYEYLDEIIKVIYKSNHNVYNMVKKRNIVL